MQSSSTAASGRLASASQRRGVTPLVLLQKRLGNSRAKSERRLHHQLLIRAETPLTLWLATTASHAMRTGGRWFHR